MEFYTWQNYRCAFDTVRGKSSAQGMPALLLVHPIGVGLSRHFWQPFIEQWSAADDPRVPVNAIYNLDLLGCGHSDMPKRAYRPVDWAQQLAYFIESVARQPVILVVQGALFPVAVELMGLPAARQVEGLVLSGPPAWPLVSADIPGWQPSLSWQLFRSPLGSAFYRYARREAFLRSFSQRQLFAKSEDVSDRWLAMLHAGSRDTNSRYAVFSFLAGFWRQDYTEAIARIQQPVIVVMGETASTIDRTAAREMEKSTGESPLQNSQKRLQDYLDRFPRAKGASIAGRNVLPYESTADFILAIAPFVAELSA